MSSKHYKYPGGQGNEDELGTKVVGRRCWSLIVERGNLLENAFSMCSMHSDCCLGDQEVAWHAGWQCCSLIHWFLGVIIAVPAVLGLYSDMKVSQ